MAKDPAFLFYPGDWLGGVMTFSRYHKGAYMDLLMCQFNHGHMSVEVIRTILGEKDFEELWEDKLKAKFQMDGDGNFYNVKLEQEKTKRKKFTDSRHKNLASTPVVLNNDSHMGSHMQLHMENVDVDGICISTTVLPGSGTLKKEGKNYPPRSKPSTHPTESEWISLFEKSGVEKDAAMVEYHKYHPEWKDAKGMDIGNWKAYASTIILSLPKSDFLIKTANNRQLNYNR